MYAICLDKHLPFVFTVKSFKYRYRQGPMEYYNNAKKKENKTKTQTNFDALKQA